MSLGDTSSAKLRLAQEDLDTNGKPKAYGDSTFAKWWDLPFTSESLSQKLSSAQSGAMRNDRQMSGTRLVRGEASGDVTMEAAFGEYFDICLESALQTAVPFTRNVTQPANGAGALSTEATAYDDTNFPYATGDVETIDNGKSDKQYAFHKSLEGGDGNVYHDVYRGCQINTLTFDFQANALATFSIGVRGLDTDSPASVATGTEQSYNLDDMFDTSYNATFDFYDGTTPIPVTAQNLTLTIDNQMRGQAAVGSFGDAGVASGRFKAMVSGAFYFFDKSFTNKFKSNAGVTCIITLTSSAGYIYRFRMYNVKVTTDDLNAGGADQDLLQNLELQAFPDENFVKTMLIDRIVPELP